MAAGRSQRPCSSTMTSIPKPAASRIASTTARPRSRSAWEMPVPPVRSAAWSNGHTFMPRSPSAHSSLASSPGRCRNASRSSNRPGPPAAAQAPVLRDLPRRAAHVPRAGAGVVHPDPVPDRPAEQVDHRQPGTLAEQVPQRQVDRAVAAGLHAAALVADIGREQPGHALGGGVPFAEQHRGGRVVQVGLDRGGAEERLAEAGGAVVGVQPEQEQVGLGGRPQCLQRDDLHPPIIRHPGRWWRRVRATCGRRSRPPRPGPQRRWQGRPAAGVQDPPWPEAGQHPGQVVVQAPGRQVLAGHPRRQPEPLRSLS